MESVEEIMGGESTRETVVSWGEGGSESLYSL